jgi:hypothetical protein
MKMKSCYVDYKVHSYTVSTICRLFKHEKNSRGQFSDDTVDIEYMILNKDDSTKKIELDYYDKKKRASLHLLIIRDSKSMITIDINMKYGKVEYKLRSPSLIFVNDFDIDKYYSLLKDMKPYITLVSLVATKMNTIENKKKINAESEEE